MRKSLHQLAAAMLARDALFEHLSNMVSHSTCYSNGTLVFAQARRIVHARGIAP